jgi:hypothetical protein
MSVNGPKLLLGRASYLHLGIVSLVNYWANSTTSYIYSSIPQKVSKCLSQVMDFLSVRDAKGNKTK